MKSRYRSDDMTLVKRACADNVVEMVSLLVVPKALSDKEETKSCHKIADKDSFKVYISELLKRCVYNEESKVYALDPRDAAGSVNTYGSYSSNSNN